MNSWQRGAVVVSKAGHDKGDAFLITGLEGESFVLIADGKRRKTERPKRKKRMHLFLTPVWSQELADKMENGVPLTDAEVSKAIRDSGWNKKRQEQEG